MSTSKNTRADTIPNPFTSEKAKETLRRQLLDPETTEYVISWAESSSNRTLKNAVRELVHVQKQRTTIKDVIKHLLDDAHRLGNTVAYLDRLEEQLLGTAVDFRLMDALNERSDSVIPPPILQDIVRAFALQLAVNSNDNASGQGPSIRKPSPKRYNPLASSSQTGRRTPPSSDKPTPQSRQNLHRPRAQTEFNSVHEAQKLQKQQTFPPRRTRAQEKLQRSLDRQADSICWVCDQKGHWSWNCTEHWCNICKRRAPGHPLGECPRDKGKRKEEERSLDDGDWDDHFDDAAYHNMAT